MPATPAIYQPELARVAVTGTVFKAPLGTAMPLPGAAIGASWSSLGTFTDDGVEHEFSEDTADVTSWQNGVIRTIVTGRSLTLKLKALESSPTVLETFYGSALVGATDKLSASLKIKATVSRPREAFLFEWVDGPNTWRLLVAVGQVSELESPAFKNSEAVTWGMTVKALGANGDLAEWQITDHDVLKAKGIEPTP
ncbi:hypothetical protein OG401_23830 [Kitasatospora purpeofusca]|uniref:phage tail tube protein n=1 Tax=Kitasatospora purpeofusca TaxID=67352 RepID=UPI00225963CD|nr:hypothetical protein [Kitasatospora purpeofusca]MCX4687294.1 hypothetical protein [Kitasatospora purpeofusca]